MISSVKTIVSTLKLISRYGAPSHILYFGESLGDNLLLTTLAKALFDRGHQNIWIKCDHRDLFTGNPHIKLVIPYNTLLSIYLLKIFKVKLISPGYTHYQPEKDQDLIPDKHIILKMADWLGLNEAIKNKPILNLTASELTKGSISSGKIVIVTSTIGAKMPMKNKEWVADSYQQIVDRFADKYKFIQLGSKGDSPLENVIDLRGKTTIRESAAILKNALLLITHVGFMMHLARAVDCRSVIIYGGREKPGQTGYPCFQNIYSDVECAPCWLHNKCDHHRKCMTMISVDMVQNAILRQLELNKVPLTVDLLHNR